MAKYVQKALIAALLFSCGLTTASTGISGPKCRGMSLEQEEAISGEDFINRLAQSPKLTKIAQQSTFKFQIKSGSKEEANRIFRELWRKLDLKSNLMERCHFSGKGSP
jgi:hypothetical protein